MPTTWWCALLLAGCSTSAPITAPTPIAPLRAATPSTTAVARHYPPASVTGVLASPAPTLAQLCTPGYTATVRPPAAYTTALKRRQMAAWHLTGPTSAFEEDHLSPLELGGDPRSEANLWPEPISEAHVKDLDENALHTAVCSHRMTLADAQHRILTDWGPR